MRTNVVSHTTCDRRLHELQVLGLLACLVRHPLLLQAILSDVCVCVTDAGGLTSPCKSICTARAPAHWQAPHKHQHIHQNAILLDRLFQDLEHA